MNEIKLPFYAKSTIILLGLILLTIALYYLQDILVPLAFAMLLSVLLNPVVRFLERNKFPKILAISLTVIVAVVLVLLFFYFLASQFALFADAFPQLKVRFDETLASLQQWLKDTFGISSRKQLDYLKQSSDKAFQYGGAILGQTLSTVTSILIVITLLPVYIFLILLYRPLLTQFLIQLFRKNHAPRVSETITDIRSVIQSYVSGLLIEAVIVAILNSTGLLILGIDYAILLGVVGAILNVIPYIGGLVAILLPVIMALITKDGYGYPLAVIVIYSVIQFIDNNVLVPKIVASKVKLNAIVSIIAVLCGGAIWGTAGMFLSIPLVAILKILFDKIPSLNAWGLLLGDELPEEKKAPKPPDE